MQTAEQQFETSTPPVPGKPKTFAIGAIVPAARNPRQTFDQADLEELTQSIRTHGFQGALTVRERPDGSAELVCGERRLRAATMAGLTELLCIVCDLSDEAAYDLALAENKARRDLHPLEEAEAFKVKQEEFKRSAAEIAATIGEEVQYVAKRLQLLKLCDEGKEAFRAGRLTFHTALLASRIPDQDLQRQAIKEITSPNGQGDAMAPGAAAAHVRHRYMLELGKAPFPIADATLVPAAGACSSCVHRTGNQRELFSDVSSPDVCTKPPCYQAKATAHGDRIVEEAKRRGAEVLGAKKAKEIFPSSWSGMNSRELVDLSATCHDDPKRRTFGQLLGTRKEPAKPEVVVRNPHTGTVHQLVHAKGLKQKIKKAGHDFTAKREAAPKLSPKKQREREEAARKKRVLPAVHKTVVGEIVEAAMRRKPDAAFWLLLVRAFAEFAEGETFERRGIDVGDPFAVIKHWNEAQLRGIAVEVMLESERVEPWHTELAERVRDFAKHYGVDVARIEKAAIAADARATSGDKGKGKKGEATPRAAAKPARDFKRAAAGDDEGDEEDDEGEPAPVVCRTPTIAEQHAFVQEHPEFVAPMPAAAADDTHDGEDADRNCLLCGAGPRQVHALNCEDWPAVNGCAKVREHSAIDCLASGAPRAEWCAPCLEARPVTSTLDDTLVEAIARRWLDIENPDMDVDDTARSAVRGVLLGDPAQLDTWTFEAIDEIRACAERCGYKAPAPVAPARPPAPAPILIADEKLMKAIEAASSTDTLAEGKLRKPVQIDGRLWANVGSVSRGGSRRVDLWRLTPETDWTGPKYSHQQLVSRFDVETWRGDHTGQLAAFGKQRFVLDGERRVYSWGPDPEITGVDAGQRQPDEATMTSRTRAHLAGYASEFRVEQLAPLEGPGAIAKEVPASVPTAPVTLDDATVSRIARVWTNESGPVDPEEMALVREGLSGDPELLTSGKWTTAGLRDLYRVAKVCGVTPPDVLLPACLQPHGRNCTDTAAVIAGELGPCEVCEPAVNAMRAEAEQGRCRVCRCTELDACGPRGCSWANAERTLCSSCVGRESEGRDETWKRIVNVQKLGVQRVVQRWSVTREQVHAALNPDVPAQTWHVRAYLKAEMDVPKKSTPATEDGAHKLAESWKTHTAGFARIEVVSPTGEVTRWVRSGKGWAWSTAKVAQHVAEKDVAGAGAAKRATDQAADGDADPALRVACKMCRAKPGEKCRTPGLHVPRAIHRERRRDEAALPDTKTLTVACPDCKAAPSQWCRRPSGGRADAIHNARQDAIGKD